MPSGKTTGYEMRRQVRLAATHVDRIVDHFMAADVLAKGGTIYGPGKADPAGIDVQHPPREGHPVLNEYLPVLLTLCTGLKDAIRIMVKKM
jgi:hypothetical protein